MRWPGANLEEKHEPRGVSVAEAQNGDSMKSSGRNLTLAAIEKQSFYLRADRLLWVKPRRPAAIKTWRVFRQQRNGLRLTSLPVTAESNCWPTFFRSRWSTPNHPKGQNGF